MGIRARTEYWDNGKLPIHCFTKGKPYFPVHPTMDSQSSYVDDCSTSELEGQFQLFHPVVARLKLFNIQPDVHPVLTDQFGDSPRSLGVLARMAEEDEILRQILRPHNQDYIADHPQTGMSQKG